MAVPRARSPRSSEGDTMRSCINAISGGDSPWAHWVSASSSFSGTVRPRGGSEKPREKFSMRVAFGKIQHEGRLRLGRGFVGGLGMKGPFGQSAPHSNASAAPLVPRIRLNRRLGIDLESLQHTGVHIVGADQDRELDDSALAEKAAERRIHGIGNLNLARHGVGIGKGGAIALSEQA